MVPTTDCRPVVGGCGWGRGAVLRTSPQPVDDVEPRQRSHEAVAVALAVRREPDVGELGDAGRVGRRNLPHERALPGRQIEAVESQLQIAGSDVETFALVVAPIHDLVLPDRGHRARLPSVDRVDGPLVGLVVDGDDRVPSRESCAPPVPSGVTGRGGPAETSRT